MAFCGFNQSIISIFFADGEDVDNHEMLGAFAEVEEA